MCRSFEIGAIHLYTLSIVSAPSAAVLGFELIYICMPIRLMSSQINTSEF